MVEPEFILLLDKTKSKADLLQMEARTLEGALSGELRSKREYASVEPTAHEKLRNVPESNFFLGLKEIL